MTVVVTEYVEARLASFPSPNGLAAVNKGVRIIKLSRASFHSAELYYSGSNVDGGLCCVAACERLSCAVAAYTLLIGFWQPAGLDDKDDTARRPAHTPACSCNLTCWWLPVQHRFTPAGYWS